MNNMIETRVADYTFAAMDEDYEQALKEVCRKFASDMRFHFEWSYYAIYFEEERWLLANLAMPGIDNILIKQ